jgi:hypothetical protein
VIELLPFHPKLFCPLRSMFVTRAQELGPKHPGMRCALSYTIRRKYVMKQLAIINRFLYVCEYASGMRRAQRRVHRETIEVMHLGCVAAPRQQGELCHTKFIHNQRSLGIGWNGTTYTFLADSCVAQGLSTAFDGHADSKVRLFLPFRQLCEHHSNILPGCRKGQQWSQ